MREDRSDWKDCVFLKSALGWVVDLLIFAACKANKPIAHLKASNIAADLGDLTGDVWAEDKWVFELDKHDIAILLD